MKRSQRVLAVALALIVINLATQVVVRFNFSAGLYPAKAEIGIPLSITLYLSLLLAGWLALLAVFSRLSTVRAYFSRGGARSDLVIAGIGALYLAPLVASLGGLVYWAEPGHYPIAAAYAALLVIVMALARDDFQTLRAIQRPRRARAAGRLDPSLPPARPGIWYAISAALFLYALPYIHNLACFELPFNSGYDLALLYLGLPALAVAAFGGRWIGARLGFASTRTGALMAGAALFVWVVLLGQGYVLLANALLSPQRPLLYEGVILEKPTPGFLGSHILRIQLASATPLVMSMEVSEYDFSRLQVGDHVKQPMVLGALGIPYIARCRWLPSRRRGGM